MHPESFGTPPVLPARGGQHAAPASVAVRRERVPPLLWIRAFEAAARHNSFLAAGRELSVSAAAVSRCIKELEESIGAALFARCPCGVELTAMGRRYAQALTPALRQIAAACADIRAAVQSERIRVS